MTEAQPAEYGALSATWRQVCTKFGSISDPWQTALSPDPAERASCLIERLLSDLDAIEAKSAARARPAWPCHHPYRAGAFAASSK